MLSTQPTILNSASLTHAELATSPAPRDGAAAGPGFAALMQQQTNLRLADQRLAEQRLSEQRLLDQRLAGQRRSEHRTAATPEPNAASEARAGAPVPTDAGTGAPARAARPQSAVSADASDRAAAPSASRRGAVDAEAGAEAGADARAQTLADTASLARARSAARTAQRRATANDGASNATPPATLQAGDRGVAALTGADTAALPTATAAATPDAGALQAGLQMMGPGGPGTSRPGARASGPEVDTGGAGALAALAGRTRPQADAPATRARTDASATGASPIAPDGLPTAWAALADGAGRQPAAGPVLSSDPTATRRAITGDDPRASGRAVRPGTAADIARTPAEGAAPPAAARTAAALAAQAALALAGGAGPTAAPGPSTRASGGGTDPSAPLAGRDTDITAAFMGPSDEVAAAAAAALADTADTTAMAAAASAQAAASASQVSAGGMVAATTTAATIAAVAGAQQRAPGVGTPASGPDVQRSGDVASAPRSGPGGSTSPAGTDAAARHPGAPDGVPPGMAAPGAPGRDAGADAVRPAVDGPPAPAGLKDDAPAARPPEPTGVLASNHAGTRADTLHTSTPADPLRAAEAGPGTTGHLTPLANMAPAASTTAASPQPAAAAPVPEARIPVPLDSPAFAPALGAQISLFARDGVQTARLQLNPAEMGPISVQIALDGSAARVDFQADLAGTREVIEASLPALAGALQDAGLTLTGGGVFQQAPGRQGQDPAPGSAPSQRSTGRDLDGSQAGPPPETLVRARRGLVDLVA